MTLFPIPLDAGGHVPSWVSATNFALFERMGTRTQILGNVVMGIPFGFLAWFVLTRRSAARVLLVGIGMFAAIEVLQLAIGLLIGVPGYRILDINDVILNTTGVMIGIVGFLIVRSLFRVLDSRLTAAPGPLRSYLRSVATSGDTPGLNAPTSP